VPRPRFGSDRAKLGGTCKVLSSEEAGGAGERAAGPSRADRVASGRYRHATVRSVRWCFSETSQNAEAVGTRSLDYLYG
jgi:hypothetical protein